MAGKSNKGRNKKVSHGSAAEAVPVKENTTAPELIDANGSPAVESNSTNPEVKDAENSDSTAQQPKQGDLQLYAVPVKTQSGEKLELQLNPGDSVMDIRQFLLDAPETCFHTCYDLLLHTKDGSTHFLEDYNEISEVADITIGNCTLEMRPALYDDRSIRAHVNRTRDLLSLSTLHASLSTSLALQHETTQNKTSAVKDNSKIEVPELDTLGLMEDVFPSLGSLLSSNSKEIKCVESIIFSSFNPPPSYRRLVGDLIYLDVVTLEGNAFCITGTTTAFYVNSSSGATLDPRPSKAAAEASTLVGLLQKISSKFKKAFREILERKASAHPFENVQSLLPPNSWLGIYPLPEHKRDAARAEDSLTLSYGSELIGMQRDWNEELQSCREFPHATPHERILRDRALYKVTSDFVDAAVNGAMGVINRCIPPINPTDPECFHMYVHNNIFFSFAVDADVEQLSKKRSVDFIPTTVGNSTNISSEMASTELVHASSANDGKIEVSNTGYSAGAVEQEPDLSAEAQITDSEQATYASANNDLKGTKAYQEADVAGLYNLAMAIIDYRGHRVVAQSVLPGILQGDKSDSLLYGSVDNGKKICWNQDFHSKVLEAAKILHIKEHEVLDGSGNVFRLAAPVECKGIVGSDDRHYLLDLMRVTPRDANYTGAGSRFCILRPELVTAYCQAQAAEKAKNKANADSVVDEQSKTEGNADVDEHAKIDKATDEERAELQKAADSDDYVKIEADDVPESKETLEERIGDSENQCTPSPPEVAGAKDDLLFNPNVFTEFKLAGNEEEIAADEEHVRKVSSYLIEVVIPKFVQDLCTLEVSPMDGQTLTEALHAHGINVRYIGKVAEGTRNLPHLWDLCCNEIVVRSAKHIFKDTLRDAEDHDLGPAVSHFLNCFFGDCQPVGAKGSGNMQSRVQKKDQTGHQSPGKSSKGQTRWKGRTSTKKNQSPYKNSSSESLWSDIQEFAKIKYKFDLPEDARTRVKKIAVIRNFCQKVGISVAARKYDLTVAAPFQTNDVFNIQPVVKHSIPVSSEAKDLVEFGKVQLAEGMLGEAYTLFSEAFSLLQQVTGPMHREVANCCRYLAMVLYHAGDMPGAIMQQHKELIINERCLGLDHPDTAHSYGNMALFYHGLNQTELALRHMSRALLLLSLSSGPDHPDVAATFINVAMMYQDIGNMDKALRYLQEALKKNERLLGEEHIQTAVCYHALAIAFNCMGAFKLSHQNEKKTYDILVKQLGEEDSRTRDSQNWMNTFKMRENQANAQKQKGQAFDAASAKKAFDLLKAHPDLMQAFQAGALGSGSGSSSSSMNQQPSSVNSTTSSKARGFDERAAKAAAEVRKKAAARGIPVRSSNSNSAVQVQPSSSQALRPPSQLFNIMNPAAAAVSTEKEKTTDVLKKKPKDNSNTTTSSSSSSSTSNGAGAGAGAGAEGKTAPSSQQQAGQPPMGLGQGLASLDSKKQKAKSKVSDHKTTS